jgi:hypothetical protein
MGLGGSTAPAPSSPIGPFETRFRGRHGRLDRFVSPPRRGQRPCCCPRRPATPPGAETDRPWRRTWRHRAGRSAPIGAFGRAIPRRFRRRRERRARAVADARGEEAKAQVEKAQADIAKANAEIAEARKQTATLEKDANSRKARLRAASQPEARRDHDRA